MAKRNKHTEPHSTPAEAPVLASGGTREIPPFAALRQYTPPPAVSADLYRALRAAIPVIDTAIYKLMRLVGGFQAVCADARAQAVLDEFINTVPCDGAGASLQTFADCFFEQLLTYGTAVAEMVTDEDGAVRYLYNAPQNAYLLRRDPKDFRKLEVLSADTPTPVAFPRQENLLVATLNPAPGAVYGTSLLEGLPFISSTLMKIYQAIGQNWERVGNVRFAVTYHPPEDALGKANAKTRAMQIANEWSEAMRQGEVRDFIAVGDVDIKVIGADNQILDSEVPVRQCLEQIVAKLSLPPYMLGLSWSTTERMASEQADILTTELEHYRRILTPVLRGICQTHLRAYGCDDAVSIQWDDITLKDTVEEATVRHLNAETAAILENLPEAARKE